MINTMTVTRTGEQPTEFSGAFVILIFSLVRYFGNINLPKAQINWMSGL